MLLHDRENVQAVTWGQRVSLEHPESDAAVAPRVAQALGVPHRFYATDVTDDSMAAVLDRYVSVGEGRVDHVGGYLDGFKIWKTLFDEGYDAILRGDVCFPHIGSPPVDPFDVRQNASIWLLRLCDYRDLPTAADMGLPSQELPDELCPKRGETLATYRDRLYHGFRMPIVLSALNELKAAYVEVVNPFVSTRLIDLVRHQPDAIRADKSILRQYVHDAGPEIPIARCASIESFDSLWGRPDLKEVLAAELKGELSRRLMSSAVLRVAEDGIGKMAAVRATSGTREGTMCTWRHLKRTARRLRRRLTGPRPWGKPIADHRVFAFRAFLIARTCRLFFDDARFLSGAI
jgi:hypothetical protein